MPFREYVIVDFTRKGSVLTTSYIAANGASNGSRINPQLKKAELLCCN
jgi:hypothetical protein